jgi:hypothetical protein
LSVSGRRGRQETARDCGSDPHCFAVPYGPRGYGIRADQPVFIFWRYYLEPSTKTGPSYGEIVYDRAITFDPYRAASGSGGILPAAMTLPRF